MATATDCPQRALAMPNPDQILSAAQMRGAEGALVAQDVSVDELMQRAGRGAAEWVWRAAGGRAVTVLCGPGNNGGDGYVIAEALRERGCDVAVIAAAEPRSPAATTARWLWQGETLGPGSARYADVLVDCLYGSGLTRALSADDAALLRRLAARHHKLVAVDLPSGITSDSGAILGEALPRAGLTLALGAWKFAHWLMPSSAEMGALRLVDIGIAGVRGAATLLARAQLTPPAASAHKYRRGLLAVVGGAMPGAALLACAAAQRSGAGYVKLLAESAVAVPADLVAETGEVAALLADPRIAALLVGPGLGRNDTARARLTASLARDVATVIDADALMLLGPADLAGRSAATIATPHEGELARLERAFGCHGDGTKVARAAALAQASGMIIVAKGPDTVVASPTGAIVIAPPAPSWLSVAGTGDVLAGTIASRLATGVDPLVAAGEGVWLHGEAAHVAGPAFTALMLAEALPRAVAAAL